jgi:hypothetical protein
VFSSDLRARRIVCTDCSKYPATAIVNRVAHLQADRYSAALVEVFDVRTGALHAVPKRTTQGIQIVCKRNMRE